MEKNVVEMKKQDMQEQAQTKQLTREQSALINLVLRHLHFN